MKSVINRAVAICCSRLINTAANIGSASITRQSEIGKAATSLMLIGFVMVAVADTVYAQTSVDTATRSLTEGFTKLLGIVFGPIRWIISVVGILIGLWHIFAGVRPDSRRTGMWVIIGVLAYAFAPTIVSFVFSIAGNQTFRQGDMNTITVGQ